MILPVVLIITPITGLIFLVKHKRGGSLQKLIRQTVYDSTVIILKDQENGEGTIIFPQKTLPLPGDQTIEAYLPTTFLSKHQRLFLNK